jgi:hypothetical protein
VPSVGGGNPAGGGNSLLTKQEMMAEEDRMNSAPPIPFPDEFCAFKVMADGSCKMWCWNCKKDAGDYSDHIGTNAKHHYYLADARKKKGFGWTGTKDFHRRPVVWLQ